jgi:hypothetical protein
LLALGTDGLNFQGIGDWHFFGRFVFHLGS